MKDFKQQLINQTIKCLKSISVRENKSFCADKAKAFMQATLIETANKAHETVRSDMIDASFGLETKKPTRLQIEVGHVAFVHAATLWAKDVFKECVINN